MSDASLLWRVPMKWYVVHTGGERTQFEVATSAFHPLQMFEPTAPSSRTAPMRHPPQRPGI